MFRCGRLLRGCSLEVIFEEEDHTPFSPIAQPSADDCSPSLNREAHHQRVVRSNASSCVRVYKRRRSRSLSALLDPPIEVLSEDPDWDSSNPEGEDSEWDPRKAPLSRRHIIERNLQDWVTLLDPSRSPDPDFAAGSAAAANSYNYEANIKADFLIRCPCGSGQVVFKVCLEQNVSDNMPLNPMQMIPESEPFPSAGPAKRRTSIYEALAMANQASQGSMTRRYRQFFEEQSHRLEEPKGGSVAGSRPVSIPTPTPTQSATTVPETIPTQTSHPQRAKRHNVDMPLRQPAREILIVEPKPPCPEPQLAPPQIVRHHGLRCEVCAAPIQPVNPKPDIVSPKSPSLNIQVQESADPDELTCKPTNKEVVEDELPKPNTVKNVRGLFESENEGNNMTHPYATFRPTSVNGRFSMGHVKSNPSSKILRSESLSSLNQLQHYHISRSSSTLSLHAQPHTVLFTLPKEDMEPLEEKGYVVALGRLAPLRSPLSRQDRECSLRSPSPPPYRTGSTAPHRSLRNSQSHPPEFARSYVDSIFSEASEWSNSDWDNNSETASSSASSPRAVVPAPATYGGDGVRYIAPDVLEKIRSYGLTFQFVDGKMVSSDNDNDDADQVMKAPVSAPSKTHHSAVPAKAPQVTAAVPAKKNNPIPTRNLKNTKATVAKTVSAPLLSDKGSTPPPRIISYVPKTTSFATPTTERNRHCSGDSSASSSGVSSGAQRTESLSSESESSVSNHSSPFCSLKRVKKRQTPSDHAFFECDRPCSPGPAVCPTVKSVTESIYGMYSVMYNFQHSQVTPHVKV